MRLLLVAGVLLGLSWSAEAQQLPPAPAGTPPGVSLSLTAEQTRLIVQTLGQIGCQTVTQFTICEEARDLLREIQRQAREQIK